MRPRKLSKFTNYYFCIIWFVCDMYLLFYHSQSISVSISENSSRCDPESKFILKIKKSNLSKTFNSNRNQSATSESEIDLQWKTVKICHVALYCKSLFKTNNCFSYQQLQFCFCEKKTLQLKWHSLIYDDVSEKDSLLHNSPPNFIGFFGKIFTTYFVI